MSKPVGVLCLPQCFFGSLPETSDVIAVSDIEADVFDILLRYFIKFSYDDPSIISLNTDPTIKCSISCASNIFRCLL